MTSEANLPSIENRKRFLTCVAVALASVHDYDVPDDSMDGINGGGFRKETSSDDDEGDGLTRITRKVSVDSSDDDISEKGGSSMSPIKSNSSLRSTNSSSSSLSFLGVSKRMTKQETFQLRTEKRRRRRYEFASEFLTSSASYLDLDVKDAQNLIPILQPLLVPIPSPPSPSSTPKHSKNIEDDYEKLEALAVQQVEEAVETIDTKNTASETNQDDKTDDNAKDDNGNSTDNENKDDYLVVEHPQPCSGDLFHDSDIFRTNVEEMMKSSPQAGFHCLTLLLFQHLLASKEGYDSRARYAIKRLGVSLFVHDRNRNSATDTDIHRENSELDPVAIATRRFESFEHVIAERILTLAKESNQAEKRKSQSKDDDKNNNSNDNANAGSERKGPSREQIVRGLKIGTAGVVAGTLLVVTGGMAAPGIAAGIGALGLGAVGATFVTLATSTAVISIFGVAGGGLAMYKMNRRTAGLTEFSFHQVTGNKKDEQEAVLSRTVCISGWLKDIMDFQRPWGVSPTDPEISDKVELLQRFYAIHNFDLIPYAKEILKRWDNDEKKLWKLLKEKYGEDPNHLYPLKGGARIDSELEKEEIETLDQVILEVGQLHEDKTGDGKGNHNSNSNKKDDTKAKKTGLASSITKAKNNQFAKLAANGKKFGLGGWGSKKSKDSTSSQKEEEEEKETKATPPAPDTNKSSAKKHYKKFVKEGTKVANQGGKMVSAAAKIILRGNEKEQRSWKERMMSASSFEKVPYTDNSDEIPDDSLAYPKHISTVWDYRANYGGELYTVKWESEVVMELCRSVAELAYEMASMAGKQALKTTMAATLVMSVVLPVAVYNAMNGIDSTWTLAIERSDAAGVELARSLLSNRAGRRPVTLVGYSFGARAIYSCLRELVRYQEIWEEKQEQKARGAEHNDEDGDLKKSKSKKFLKKKSSSSMEPELECEPACVVEDVILMGTPIRLSLSAWKSIRQVVAGRVINVYSRKDMVLSYMFKYKNLTGGLKPVCGTCTVAVPGVENVDVTDLVQGHEDYITSVGPILTRIRHGQPMRFSSNAIDEEALIAKVNMALEEEKEEIAETEEGDKKVVVLEKTEGEQEEKELSKQ